MSSPEEGLPDQVACGASPVSPQWSSTRLLAANALIASAYVVLAVVSFTLREPSSGVASMWAPLGLAVFVIFHYGVRCLPGVVLGVIAAAVLSQMALPMAALHGLGQIFAPWAGGMLLRRLVEKPGDVLERTDGALKLIAIAYATALPSAVATVVAMAVVQGGDHWMDTAFAAWLGDALGIIVAMLPLLAWTSGSLPAMPARRILEQIAVVLALLGVLGATFFGVTVLAEPMLQLYAALPLVIWVALRFPPRLGWSVFLAASLIALVGTANGYSLLNDHPLATQIYVLHGLIILTAVTALLIGAAMFEKQAARRALRERESHFRALTLLSADWHWELDADLRYHRLPDQLTGVHFGDAEVDGCAPWEIVGEEALTLPWGLLRQTVERHEAFRDFLSRRRDGTRWRYLASSGEPVFDASETFSGYRGVSRDITAEMQAREALREEEFRLRALVDALPELIVLKDRHLRWRLANRSLLDTRWLKKTAWLGATSEELAAHLPSLTEVLRKDHAIAEHVALSCKPHFEEQRLALSDGDERTFELSVIPLTDDEGRFNGLVSVRRDVTAQREAERLQAEHVLNVQSLNDELEKRVLARTVALESAIKELEAFSYSVSHDLRAPLRALDGFSRLLVEDYGDLLDEQGREYLSRIRRNSQRMGELIDDLLELSRVSRAEVRRTLTNLSDMARDIVRELTNEAPERHVLWVIPEGLWADADPGLARVVLENLLRNAWKFTRLQAQPRIEIVQSELEGQPAYAVRDNGVGFDMAYAGRLFAPFQRLHNNREFDGSGIGLAIVQRVIRLHDGHVAAQGVPGQGATFSFSFGSGRPD